MQCAFAVAEVRKVTTNLSQTCGFAVADLSVNLRCPALVTSFDDQGFMDFGFVGCLAFSNYFKLLHVIWLSFARTAFFFICSLMALLLDLETFKCSPALILKCLADVTMYVTFTSREQVNL